MSDDAAIAKPRTRIRFDFTPVQEQALYAVEKEDGGIKRKYLYGISSGSDIDGHGERMTPNCIDSFHRQAVSGDILLYAAKHEVDFTEDIGKLVESSIDGNGDWVTGYRLYDELDGIGPAKLEIIDTIWKQVNGIAPYTKARKYGFSIEGDIPEGGIKFLDGMGRRTMDDVELAGVVLVRKPAYKTSVAHAVMKAIGIPTTNEIRRALLGEHLADRLQEQERRQDYYDTYYQMQNALEDMIRCIMKDPDPDKYDRLKEIFDEYGVLMIQLIVSNPEIFQDTEEMDSGAAAPPSTIYEATTDRKQDLFNRLVTAYSELQEFVDNLKNREGPNGDQSGNGKEG